MLHLFSVEEHNILCDIEKFVKETVEGIPFIQNQSMEEGSVLKQKLSNGEHSETLDNNVNGTTEAKDSNEKDNELQKHVTQEKKDKKATISLPWFAGCEYQCRICSIIFHYTEDLRSHINKNHGSTFEYIEKYDNLETNAVFTTCKSCRKSVKKNFQSICKHLDESHNGMTLDQYAKKFGKSRYLVKIPFESVPSKEERGHVNLISRESVLSSKASNSSRQSSPLPYQKEENNEEGDFETAY